MNAKLEVVEGRPTIELSNRSVTASIELRGGMMPMFAFQSDRGKINMHWIPAFRPPAKLSSGAGAGLLDILAGDFLCSPNFGPGCTVQDAVIPSHGWTANMDWRLLSLGIERDSMSAYCDLELDSPATSMPLNWRQRLCVIEGQNAYYRLVSIKNCGDKNQAINIGQHNTLGEPFLEPGCRIYLPSRSFVVQPKGSEFDTTGRLVPGAEFDSLNAAPLRSGGLSDISIVPGLIGYTDLVVGLIPPSEELGWSCAVNPRLGLGYLCFFPGQASIAKNEIALSFNYLWMQYGGRPFRPWAEIEGGIDTTFCLGTENATGAYANGLAYSSSNPTIMGAPTMIEVPAHGEKRLAYGVAIVELEPSLLKEGILSAEIADGFIILKGGKSYQCVPLEGNFDRPRASLRWNGS